MATGEGTPLHGDRGVWNDIDFPTEHSKSIQEENWRNHLPTPTDSPSDAGKIARLNVSGTAWEIGSNPTSLPGVFVITDYGAAPSPSVSTTAIQTAIDTAHTVGGIVYLPPGLWLSGQLTCYRNVSLVGAGIDITTLRCNSATSLLSYAQVSFVNSRFTGHIKNLKLDGNGVGTIGLDLNGGWELFMEKVWISGWVTVGLYLKGVLGCWFDKVVLFGNPVGVAADILTMDVGPMQTNLNRFTNCTLNGNSGYAVYWTHGSLLLLDSCDIESNGTDGVANTGAIYYKPTTDGTGIQIKSCWLEANVGMADIEIGEPEGNNQNSLIDDCLFVHLSPKTLYGVQIDGATHTNKLIVNNCQIVGAATTADYYANGVDTTIYLEHSSGTTTGSGSFPGGSGGNVSDSGSTIAGHLAVWNANDDHTIIDGGAVPTGGGSGGVVSSSLMQRGGVFIGEFSILSGCGGALVTDASITDQFYQAYWYQHSAANGDSIQCSTVLKAGTYSFGLLGIKSTNTGITKCYIDDVLFATFDWYNNPQLFSQIQTGSFTATYDGRHIIKIVIDGKNGSSSNYYFVLTRAWWVATPETIDAAYGEQRTGWVDPLDTWTYSSVDAPTGVISAVVDPTTYLSLGMRIHFTQATGGLKHGIVTKLDSSTITFLLEIGKTFANEALTGIEYSMQKCPYGFPLSEASWNVRVTDSVDYNQGTPSVGVWYNLGSLQISVPIGKWRLRCRSWIYANAASAIFDSIGICMSTSSSGMSDTLLQDVMYTVSTALGGTLKVEGIIEPTVKTTYYMNSRTQSVSIQGLNILGASIDPTILDLVSAYL